jgi:hypothetical protein
MKKPSWHLTATTIRVYSMIAGMAILSAFSVHTAVGQQLQMSEFVLFSGAGGPGTSPAASPGYAVQLGSSSAVNGGAVGSFKLIKSTGTVSFNANLYSKGTISLTNSNSVTGKIAASNSPFVTGTILSVGSNANLGGNIDVNGNIVVGGGTVSGKVTHPTGTTYSGPTPAGGNITGTPTLPVFPALPTITEFPSYATMADITSTRVITPGQYAAIKLSGNQTLTFKGTGVYVIRLIDNKNNNNFVFDFENNPTGTFLIYVHENVNLNKLSVTAINGGNASRIFTEVHGTGLGTAKYAFNIANGSTSSKSKWLGTVWAPYAAINVGSGTGSTDVTGALWSGTQVNVQSGVNIVHAPFESCVPPVANAGSDVYLCAGENTVTLTASASGGTGSYTYVWSNGMTGASIQVSPTATTTYTVTANNNGQPGCAASDAVVVNVNPALSVNAGTDATVCFQDNEATLTALASGGTAPYTYEWFVDGVAAGTGASITVSPSISTTYSVTVKDSYGATSTLSCQASDQVVVTYSEICPYYTPPMSGKTDDLIGSELSSLAETFAAGNPVNSNFIYTLTSDHVLIEVISIVGQYDAVLSLLRSSSYGLTDEIDNGENSLIITGFFPIANLPLLNELPDLINYVRPAYPPVGNVGVTTTKGDAAMRSDLVRMGYDISGKGNQSRCAVG